MTLHEAKHLHHGQILHHATDKNADGTPQRWRVNGTIKTWKTKPNKVKVPIKHGMYSHDYIDETNLHLLTIPEGEKPW